MADATEPSAETALRETDEVVTVSQLGDRLERLVAAAAEVQGFYVVGEVSDADRWNGHVFFDLLDEEEDATLECILYSYLTDEFADRLEEGALVAVKGDVQFYAPKSVVSMQVAEVLPVGEGSHAAQREELIATLDEEGLLADERKRELPAHPACLGVVTSPSGSAIEDVVATASDRDRTIDGDRDVSVALDRPVAVARFLGEGVKGSPLAFLRGAGHRVDGSIGERHPPLDTGDLPIPRVGAPDRLTLGFRPPADRLLSGMVHSGTHFGTSPGFVVGPSPAYRGDERPVGSDVEPRSPPRQPAVAARRQHPGEERVCGKPCSGSSE